jgi:3-phytase
MNTQFWSSKTIFISTLFFLLTYITTLAQTTVTPVVTYTNNGVVDEDDMCVWVHPNDNAQSTVIASDKTANKIFVYDLDGNLLQTISLPWAPGNIDIRYNFLLSGIKTDIVAVNNRTTNTIQFYKVNASTRNLISAGSINISGVFDDEDYGLSLYKSPFTGKYSVFVVDYKGTIAQWLLFDDAGVVAAVGGTFIRRWETGANATNDIAEGMVCDDELGKLYVSRENYEVAVYSAEPDSATAKQTHFASVGTDGVAADIEGITIYYAANGNGYIIFSSQGNSTFKVYDRKPPHNYVKTFTVTGVGSTDGVDVCNLNLNSTFSEGIFLCHTGASAPYLIKGVKFQDLGLTVDTNYWDPRGIDTTPQLNLISPNGGEIWSAGAQQQITWTSQNINNINIEFSSDDGSNWIPIVNSVPASGFYNDTVPDFPSTKCRIKIIDASNSAVYDISDSTFTITATSDFTEEYKNETLRDFKLFQNYPNPFNPATTINFSIPQSSNVKLTIYNILGQQISQLINEFREAGIHTINFDASQYNSGLYLYKLENNGLVQTKKMLLLK